MGSLFKSSQSSFVLCFFSSLNVFMYSGKLFKATMFFKQDVRVQKRTLDNSSRACLRTFYTRKPVATRIEHKFHSMERQIFTLSSPTFVLKKHFCTLHFFKKVYAILIGHKIKSMKHKIVTLSSPTSPTLFWWENVAAKIEHKIQSMISCTLSVYLFNVTYKQTFFSKDIPVVIFKHCDRSCM